MADEHDHYAFASSWIAGIPEDTSNESLFTVTERAFEHLWRRAAVSLGHAIVGAIVTRALAQLVPRLTCLAALRVEAHGLAFGDLRRHAEALGPGQLREALGGLLAELLADFAGYTGQVLVRPLRDALGKSSLPDAMLPVEPPDPPGASRQLECLYKVGQLLCPLGDLETAFGSALDALATAVPFASATVIDSRESQSRWQVWHPPNAQPAWVQRAERLAQDAYAHLTNATLDRSAVLRPLPSEPTPSVSYPSEHGPRQHPVMLPLVTEGGIIGALQIDPFAPLTESDLALVAAVAVQLSVALARSPARGTQAATVSTTTQAERELLSVISHDLRNPLSAILMSTALLLRKHAVNNAGDDLRQLEVIKRSGERINYLIQNLVDTVSLENGQLTIDRQPHEVPSLVGDGIQLLKSVAASKSVKIETQLPTAPSSVLADRERIVQVIANLSTTAIRFVAKGGTIIIKVEKITGNLCFSVSNSGPGIALDDLTHVFDRRWWAARSSGLGTGLALAVAKGIIEAHGGKIWADSKPGLGSVFLFTLPMAPPQPAAVSQD